MNPPCRGCRRPMRPTRAKAADYPGTVMEACKGVCKKCYLRGAHLGDVESNRRTLQAYLERRRPFREKAAAE